MNSIAEKFFNALDVAMPVIIMIWIVMYLVLGFILHYHWHRYGIEKQRSKRVVIIYFAIGAILILGMILAYITFSVQTTIK